MADSRIFKLVNDVDIEQIGVGIENFLKIKKHLYAEGMYTAEGYMVQAKQEDGWKKWVGMDAAIQVQLYKTESLITVNIGSGKWVDKAGAAIAGSILFAPLAVTAAVGAWAQKKLPEEIFNFIEQFIMTGGQNITVSMGSSRGIKDSQIICPGCHAVNDKGTRFCMSCGTALSKECPNCHASVELHMKFCTTCGFNLEEQKKEDLKLIICPECGIELLQDSKFCPECGMKIDSKRVCANCGHELNPTQKFCPECGNAVQEM